jgi:hypothetical protein
MLKTNCLPNLKDDGEQAMKEEYRSFGAGTANYCKNNIAILSKRYIIKNDIFSPHHESALRSIIRDRDDSEQLADKPTVGIRSESEVIEDSESECEPQFIESSVTLRNGAAELEGEEGAQS